MQRITQVILVLYLCVSLVSDGSAQQRGIGGLSARDQMDVFDYFRGMQLQQNEVDRVRAAALKKGQELFGKGIGWGDKEYIGTIYSRNSQELAVDDWGYLPDVMTVMNVIDGETMLVTVSDYPTNRFKQDASRVVIVKGFDTSKVTSDLILMLAHPVVIARTQTYNTVGGGAKTVLVLERNDEAIKKLVAAHEKRPDKKSTKKPIKVTKKSAEIPKKIEEIPDVPLMKSADILKLLATQRDLLGDAAKLETRGLVLNMPSGRTKVQIPQAPTAPYTLSIEAEANADRSTLVLGVPFNDSRVLIVLDASAGSTIEHQGGRDGRLYEEAVFRAMRKTRVLCDVDSRRIAVSVAGKQILNWTPDPNKRYKVDAAWDVADPRCLFVAVNNANFVISSFELTEH